MGSIHSIMVLRPVGQKFFIERKKKMQFRQGKMHVLYELDASQTFTHQKTCLYICIVEPSRDREWMSSQRAAEKKRMEEQLADSRSF